jgi:phosphatidylserine/phosphatidylglycerophosphate/cardiolipin synthase-like enzyme
MNDIASEIDNATSSVHAAMFYVEPYSTNKVIDALERAVDRGVEVRLVFSDHTLQQYPDTPTLLTDKGIPYVIISNHFKVVVIDNKIAYVGSANWNKNGLERNRELTLKTNSPDTVAEAYDLLNILWLQGSKKVVVNDFYYERFANGFEYNNLLLESIKNAQSIKVLMFMVDYNSTNMNAPETKLLNEVRSAYQRGANVQMVLDDPKYFEVPGGGHFFTRNNVPHKLDQKNIGTDERLHAKAILVDDQMLFVGSQNWHDDHLDSAQDASIITRNPQAIADYLTIFNNEWSLAHDP